MKYIGITVGVVLLNYFLDRSTKWIAVQQLKEKPSIELLKGTIFITFTENTGAFLSLGSRWPLFIKYFSLLIVPIGICLFGILYLMFKEKSIGRIVILGTIIGGGLGNLIDRLFNNFKVIDFLNFGLGNIRTGILNVADLSVTFGAIALLVYEKKREKETKLV